MRSLRTLPPVPLPQDARGRAGGLKILIVGEAPGSTEDEQGIPFCGKAGNHLQGVLQSLGINMRQDCWITNALICRPPNNKISDDRMIGYCRPNVMKTIRELKPYVVILLGGSAVRSVIGDIWREDVGPLTRWVGWNSPSQKINAWICPTYPPSYLLREDNSVLDLYFAQHLKAALAHDTRPWETLPEWEKSIEAITDDHAAALVLRQFAKSGGDVAFDYETTSIKPEIAGAEAVCASACWRGKRTIAFPWFGEVIEACRELLHSDGCWFIASNMKHENRWTKQLFGRRVRHWGWDTMQAAHILDNREGITGLKFQAFVLLGMPSYDDHIKAALRAMSGKQTNLAKTEVDLHQLLHYCGTDSLLEYKVAKIQRRIIFPDGINPFNNLPWTYK